MRFCSRPTPPPRRSHAETLEPAPPRVTAKDHGEFVRREEVEVEGKGGSGGWKYRVKVEVEGGSAEWRWKCRMEGGG